MTSTPAAVAASRSTLSTPTPARPITCKRGAWHQRSSGRHFRRAAHQQSVGIADFVGDVAFRLGKVDDLPEGIWLFRISMMPPPGTLSATRIFMVFFNFSGKSF